MPSRPYSGSSFSKLTSRISPACAWPPCTARLISGALNSDAFGCTWILSLPPRGLVDVGGELRDVLGVEVVRRIGGGQVPLGLRGGGQCDGEADRGGDGDESFHRRSPVGRGEGRNETAPSIRFLPQIGVGVTSAVSQARHRTSAMSCAASKTGSRMADSVETSATPGRRRQAAASFAHSQATASSQGFDAR